MNLSFLASLVASMGLFSLIAKRSIKRDYVDTSKFWEKEAKANFVRKKSLDGLDYITIPEHILNMDIQNINSEIDSCIEDLHLLKSQKIVNLSGISNTDLKLKYGTANITILSEYDFNYTNLVTLLQKLAQALVDANLKVQAIEVLEFSISTGSDVSKSYILLSQLYKEFDMYEEHEYLLHCAQQLDTLMKDSIVRSLKASGL